MSQNDDRPAYIFIKRASKFSDENQAQGKLLYGEMMLWASLVVEKKPFLETAGGAISSQLVHGLTSARKNDPELTMENLVDSLFSENPQGEVSAEIIMGRFQLL